MHRAVIGGAVGAAVAIVGLVLVAADAGRVTVGVVLALAALACAVTAALAARAGRQVAALERGRVEFRQAIVRLGDALGASGDREALVRITLDAAATITGADAGVFWVDRGPSIDARAVSGHHVAVGSVARGEGVVGAVCESGAPSWWPLGPSRPAAGEPPSEAALAVPLLAGGRLYGVLALYRTDDVPFGSHDLDDVVSLARQAGAAIDTTYLYEETRRLSLTDGLTGLWNRRQFELRAVQELERAARFGERFALVIVDLDGFKAVNDTHGHLVGDAVLVETAKRLVAATREVDTVARYGGEEFVLLLPQTDATGAVRVAEKVRRELADAPITVEEGLDLHITLSAGVACHPLDGASIEALLAAADAALYAAKAAGKNRVVHADVHEHGAAR